MKIMTWTVVITGLIALPLLIRRRVEMTERRDENIRYDINDYLFELEA
jgi:hypothetical protein